MLLDKVQVNFAHRQPEIIPVLGIVRPNDIQTDLQLF
jgi:hypothetical protein